MRIHEDQSRPFIIRLVSLFSKKQFGKVIAPLRSIYTKQPALFWVAAKIMNTEKKLSLAPELRQLIKTYTSQLNNCAFCSDINLFLANQMNVEVQKIKTLANFRQEPSFTAKEKAMLAYCEEVTLTRECTDDCFEELKKYFNEKEIVEITWINAAENYFNFQAKPLKLSSDGLSPFGNLKRITDDHSYPLAEQGS